MDGDQPGFTELGHFQLHAPSVRLRIDGVLRQLRTPLHPGNLRHRT